MIMCATVSLHNRLTKSNQQSNIGLIAGNIYLKSVWTWRERLRKRKKEAAVDYDAKYLNQMVLSI